MLLTESKINICYWEPKSFQFIRDFEADFDKGHLIGDWQIYFNWEYPTNYDPFLFVVAIANQSLNKAFVLVNESARSSDWFVTETLVFTKAELERFVRATISELQSIYTLVEAL